MLLQLRVACRLLNHTRQMVFKCRAAALLVHVLRYSIIHVHLFRATEGWFFAAQPRSKTPSKIPKNIKLLILPGFGNDSSDYVLEQAPQGSLVKSLQERGWQNDQICILPVRRTDWLQVFTNGLVDIKFWQGNAPPTRPSFQWYINRIVNCINEMTTPNDDDDDKIRIDNTKIVLIGHSAGGWLGRAAIGYGSVGDQANNFEQCIDLNKVGGIVTLGAPNLPPPPDKMDMTRGALRLTSSTFPGAYHKQLFYLTVIGNAVRGAKQERKTPFERASVTGFAYNSYEAVCGDGEQLGDGVVPVIAGHLDGAVQINLNGIFHSINVPEKWYGSDVVIDDWHSVMLHQIDKISKAPKIQQQSRRNFFYDMMR